MALNMRNWSVVILFFIISVFTGCIGSGLGPGGDSKSGGDADEAVPVEAVKAVTGDLIEKLWASATVESVNHVDVLAEVSGKVDRLAVEEGDTVRKGSLLCHLDNATVVNSRARAQSTVNKLEADLVDTKKLAQKGAVSWKQVRDLQYQAEQAKLNLEQMTWELAHTFVRSPIAGTVTQRDISLGEYLLPNRRLFTVVDLEHLIVKVHVPERHLARLRPGLKAEAHSDSLQMSFPAEIERINPVVDSTTGTVEVTLKVDSTPKQTVNKKLVPGMFVKVDIELGIKKGVVLIPKRAIVFEEGLPIIFLVEQGKARKVGPLKLGASNKESVEVMEGVSPGDMVMVIGQAGLKDGSRVKVVDYSKHADENHVKTTGKTVTSSKERKRGQGK
ncbi:MAG: efflux RND transporter periplasmic adaptor subunit [Deltaproteobacteria bacterium]|nr:efflux RND transporter periplasmic adaptor subunit [Deltaproteobacteria bacterium]